MQGKHKMSRVEQPYSFIEDRLAEANAELDRREAATKTSADDEPILAELRDGLTPDALDVVMNRLARLSKLEAFVQDIVDSGHQSVEDGYYSCPRHPDWISAGRRYPNGNPCYCLYERAVKVLS